MKNEICWCRGAEPTDVDDALNYMIDDGIPIKKGRFLRFEEIEPEVLWDLSVFGMGEEKGWLLGYPKKQWKKLLLAVPEMKKHHLEYLLDKSMCMRPPVAFQVEGRLIAGDGRRRAYIAFALGEKVLYAVYRGIPK